MSILGNLSQARVLDYGCGRGDFLRLTLPKSKHVCGADSDQHTIDMVNSHFDKDIKAGKLSTHVLTSPNVLKGLLFDRIICHNVLECIDDKVDFINCFYDILSSDGTFLLSHHDFDSAIFNSSNKDLTRKLVHNFVDTKQSWQDHVDGQMGRKIPGLVKHSLFRDLAVFKTMRIVERDFKLGNYGHLMADMIIKIAQKTNQFDDACLRDWLKNLEDLFKNDNYYFAIDIVIAVLKKEKNLKN